MNCRIATGHTVHERHGLAAHRFRYPTFCLVFRTDEEAELQWLLSRRYKTVLGFRARDYLEKDAGPIDPSIRLFLREHCDFEPEKVWLVTMPRMFGYAFNPVSFWLCERGEELEAALCEVNNTFGERHFYWIKPTQGPLGGWHIAQKTFHVSPFLPVTGSYRFFFRRAAESLRIDVNYFDEAGKLILSTWLDTKLHAPAEQPLLRLLFRYGWMTPLVVLRIHFQALKLWWKGASFHRKPPAPKKEVSS